MWCDSARAKFGKWNTNPVDGHRPPSHSHWDSNRIDLQSLWGQKLPCGKNPPLYFLPACKFDPRLCFLTNLDLVSNVRSHTCSLKSVKNWRGIREKKLYEFIQADFTDPILVQLLLWQQYSGTSTMPTTDNIPRKSTKSTTSSFVLFSLEAFFVPSPHDFFYLDISLRLALHLLPYDVALLVWSNGVAKLKK